MPSVASVVQSDVEGCDSDWDREIMLPEVHEERGEMESKSVEHGHMGTTSTGTFGSGRTGGYHNMHLRDKLCTAGALQAHCGRTAGTCIKDLPEEKEGGSIKQHINHGIEVFVNTRNIAHINVIGTM